MIKNLIAVIFALTLDAFQILLPASIVAVFSTASGTAAGAGAGALALQGVGLAKIGAMIGAFLGSFFNLATAPLGAALGAGLAAGIDFCISAVFGTGFIFYLLFTGFMTWQQLFSMRRLPLVIGKLVPFFGMLPFYTGLTVMCIIQNSKELPGVASAAITLATKGASRIEGARAATQEFGGMPVQSRTQMLREQMQQQGEETETDTPREVRRKTPTVMSDIRPAVNDNSGWNVRRQPVTSNEKLSSSSLSNKFAA